MVDPTPLRPRKTVFGGGPTHTRSEEGGIRPDFQDAFAQAFYCSSFFIKAISLDEQETRDIARAIENELESYADDQVYALVPGFKTDEKHLRELIGNIIEQIKTLHVLDICSSVPDEETMNARLKECLKEAAIEVCRTNIFNEPPEISPRRR